MCERSGSSRYILGFGCRSSVILRNITWRHQGSVDEAYPYAVLWDLGYPVLMSKRDSETGKVTSRTEMFCDKKPNFRPVLN